MKAKKTLITIFSTSFLFWGVSAQGSSSEIGPVALTIIGMSTVFLGLVVMNLFINLLKFVVNKPDEDEKKREASQKVHEQAVTAVEETELTEDEFYALAVAVHIENELNYIIADESLTINWQDREPAWTRIRR